MQKLTTFLMFVGDQCGKAEEEYARNAAGCGISGYVTHRYHQLRFSAPPS